MSISYMVLIRKSKAYLEEISMLVAYYKQVKGPNCFFKGGFRFPLTYVTPYVQSSGTVDVVENYLGMVSDIALAFVLHCSIKDLPPRQNIFSIFTCMTMP